MILVETSTSANVFSFADRLYKIIRSLSFEHDLRLNANKSPLTASDERDTIHVEFVEKIKTFKPTLLRCFLSYRLLCIHLKRSYIARKCALCVYVNSSKYIYVCKSVVMDYTSYKGVNLHFMEAIIFLFSFSNDTFYSYEFDVSEFHEILIEYHFLNSRYLPTFSIAFFLIVLKYAVTSRLNLVLSPAACKSVLVNCSLVFPDHRDVSTP